jgi:L-fuconolactonase
VDGCVVVQSDQSEKENEFQLQNAAANSFIKGVVGWVDLCAPDVEERLDYYSGFPKMKGFRHILEGEKDRAFMLQPAFMKGIGLLSKYNFTYDLLVRPDQLSFALQLVRQFPQQAFVIDHLAKPEIKKGMMEPWAKQISELAREPNVYCKLSGLVTEADWKNWKPADLYPYIDLVVESFGTNRLLFGSDWPVCLLAGTYTEVIQLVSDYISQFTKQEQEAVMGGNAIAFYHLNQ